MKDFVFKKLHLPQLLAEAFCLPKAGHLAVTADNLTYLTIDDEYIYKLYPLLLIENEKIKMPDYFGVSEIGAHISVIYPEENKFIPVEDLGKKYHFEITGVFTGDLGAKRYYVLGIESPSLLELRHRYGLENKLLFKEHLVDLHITIGTHPIPAKK